MVMGMEQSVELEFAKETEVPGENLPQRHLIHHVCHITWPGIEPGPL
jgi:phage-related protein